MPSTGKPNDARACDKPIVPVDLPESGISLACASVSSGSRSIASVRSALRALACQADPTVGLRSVASLRPLIAEAHEILRKLETALTKLDKYDLLVLDDLSYVHKDHAETSVLFELIGARYERRSMLITANQTFADWNKVFPDHAMMIAAVDRLVHSIIFEMNVESFRCRGALTRKARASSKTSHTDPELV